MTKKRTTAEINILWMMLDLEFMQLKPASYKEVADEVIELFLWKQRIKNSLEATIEDRQYSDATTMVVLKSMDTNDPKLVVLEKIFRQLATGRGDDAMRLLRASIENKFNEVRVRQQKNAKVLRPNNRHPLSQMVDPIVAKKPNIKVHELFRALIAATRASSKPPCTFDFEKSTFIPANKKFKAIPKKDLSHYLYRSKERINRASRLA
jgi:hypothetical protein